MKKQTVVISSVLAGVVLLGGVGAGAFAITASQVPAASTATARQSTDSEISERAEDSESAEIEATEALRSIDEMLVYLAEEEKLAHDVYQVLGDLWGGQIFTNIQSSELSHQNQVSNLLTTFGIPDPRLAEVGVFTNPDLQAFYDQLIAQGSQSATEAYKVGVLIEETDIADLQESIASTQDATIIGVLEQLKAASENHLRAFSRKI